RRARRRAGASSAPWSQGDVLGRRFAEQRGVIEPGPALGKGNSPEESAATNGGGCPMDRSQEAIPYIPGLAGVPAAESRICDIDGQRGILFYRGYPIEELAEKSTYEETAYMLLFGQLPTREQLDAFTHDLVHHRRLKYKIIDLMKTLPETGHPMDALAAAVGALGMFYPHINVMDPEERYGACVRLIAKLPTIVAAFHRMRRGDRDVLPNDDLGHAANFLYMLNEKEPDPFHAKILDTCLVLH